MNRGIEIALLFTIPGTAALLVIAHPIVSVLFERGAFDAATSLATAQALMAYAIGLPAYVLVKVLAPGFFARQDTATPVKIAIVCVTINVVLNLILIQFLAHVGIALATAISAWINAFLLAFFLHRRGQFRTDARLRQRISRILMAAIGMAAVLWGALSSLESVYAGGQTGRVALLVVLVLGGMAVYFRPGAAISGRCPQRYKIIAGSQESR